MTKIHAVDLYAGAGGTSTGLALTCKELGVDVELSAINHWKEAVETHQANHPWAKHYWMDVEAAVPREIVPGGHLDILVASPSCVYHSRAAGGRPKKEQERASPWHILRWLDELEVDSLLVENVPEFSSWGPLDADGHPIKGLKGSTYGSWVSAIESYGYTVEARVLNAADYGAPTSRSRIFIAARKGETKIRWPEPTHSQKGKGRKKWRPAKDIIDWTLEGKSIFGRKKPLSPNTIRRIVEGLKRFGGQELQPFIIQMEHGGSIKDIGDPLPTITTAKGGSMALVKPEPFVLSQASGGAPRPVRKPLPTIPGRGAHALVQPFILSQGSNGAPKSTDDDPVPAILTGGKHALIEPFIVPNFGERKTQRPRVHRVSKPLPSVTSHGAGGLVDAVIVEYHAGKGVEKRVASIKEPLKTVDTSNRFGIARPFILPVEGYFQDDGRTHNPPRDIDLPLGTITQRGYGGVVEPFIVRLNGTDESQVKNSSRSIEEPVPALATNQHIGLAEPYVLQYNGNSHAQPVTEPLPTIPTRDRFGLVQPVVNGRMLDIRFRMLQPHELAAAMTFPKGYKFTGTKTEVVKQIGNAVVVELAHVLTRSLLS